MTLSFGAMVVPVGILAACSLSNVRVTLKLAQLSLVSYDTNITV